MAETVARRCRRAAEIAACTWLPDDELAFTPPNTAAPDSRAGCNGIAAARTGAFNAELEILSGRTIDVPSCFIAGKRTGASIRRPARSRHAEERLHAHAGLSSGRRRGPLGAAGTAGGRQPAVARVPAKGARKITKRLTRSALPSIDLEWLPI